MRILMMSIAIFLISNISFGQGKPPLTEEAYDKTYKWRIQQRNLYGVYIPADIAEVFHQLNSLSDENDREKFRLLTERESATIPFFGLGRWISLNWGFYGGSRLTAYINQLGLYHPEDMTRFILIIYNRHLNKVDLNPKELVDGLSTARKEYNQKKVLEGEVIYEETRVSERPDGGGE